MQREIETRIRQIGGELFGRMERETPSIFRKDYWNGKVMDWSMKDEAFKVEMFRFVDVFPVLRTHESVAQHLQEYFCRPDQDFPAWIQLGLKSVSSGSFVAKTAASQIEKNIRSMAAQFVAGETGAEALPRLEAMRRAGLAFTVDLLGEATVSEAEARSYQARYLELIESLSDAAARWAPDPRLDRSDTGEIPRVNVSVKVSSLCPRLDPIDFDGSIRAVRENLRPILALAGQRGAFVNLDMEQYERKDLTLALFRQIVEDPASGGTEHLGCVIQAYLRDAVDDVRELIAWAKRVGRRVTVRLVKGAYWDWETIRAQQLGHRIPVFQNKWETDASYEACLGLLMANHRHIRVAVASHNVRSIAAAMALAETHGVPQAAWEVQTLYGMAEPLKQAVRATGVRVRDYAPVGELVPGMAYLVRRLLENTSNEGFLRARFVDRVDADRLLAPPSGPQRPDPVPDTPFHNEPHTDFADRRRREAFSSALASVRGQLGRVYPLSIGGRARTTARVLPSMNPARSGEVIGATSCATTADADDAIEAAWAAFPAWAARTMADRAATVRAVGDELRRRRDELAAWMVLEVGKGWREADADVAEAIDFCRYYADEAERTMGAPVRLGRHPGERNELTWRPLGVGTVIGPWNFPLAIVTGMAMGAVVTGNCVLVKPAEQAGVIAAKLAEVVQAARLPAGVFQFVPGLGEEVGAHLVRHARSRFTAFTGSREVGLDILRASSAVGPDWAGPKRTICEMGGKNAIIVDSDADQDEAVAAVIHSAFGFQGQKCSACSRVIVLEENREAFVGRLIEAARSLRIGPPEDPSNDLGPVIDAEARARVLRAIEVGKAEGRLLLQREVPSEGTYAPLAIFDGIEPHHRLAQEEIFGPVLAVMRARDFDDALRIANATSYALTGAVISRSPRNLEAARQGFDVGNLYLNRGCTGALVYRQPFGGYRFSGQGIKAGGPGYLRQFVDERSISENTTRRGFAPETA